MDGSVGDGGAARARECTAILLGVKYIKLIRDWVLHSSPRRQMNLSP